MSNATWYNEIEPYACDWLENLIKAGHIPSGRVERRSIVDLDLGEISDTAHFFAGIGGWAYALRLAGWPESLPVWTGSCPCQPFSSAGKRRGFSDKRHLWPDWFRLIKERHPPIIFGEQVASPDGLKWLDLVSADLENEDYAVGAADLCAAGVGAPHIRQRLYFVAHAREQKPMRVPSIGRETILQVRECSGLGDDDNTGLQRRREHGDSSNECPSGLSGLVSRMASADEIVSGQRRTDAGGRDQGSSEETRTRSSGGFWSRCDWIPCSDGKSRPVESSTSPLAHGISNRVGRLRAYGNAIVPQVAAVLIRAAMEWLGV